MEEDTNADGRVDIWETYENGALKTADLRRGWRRPPDRRLTYRDGALALIESAPDASGTFTKRVEVK